MPYSEATMQLAQLHVEQSEERIQRMRELIERDRSAGLPIAEHERLLEDLLESQKDFVSHRDEIAASLGRKPEQTS